MRKAIKDNFGLVWPRHVTNITRLLIIAREAFGGDLDLFLILAIIGDRSFSARKVDPRLSLDSWQANDRPLVAPEDINIRSIAHFSGIPRETVRRKLDVLVEKGWVSRNRKKMLVATPKARRELEPLTQGALLYLEEMFQLFQELNDTMN